jgi:hypothetical protein
MTKKKVVTSRLIGIPVGSKALQSPKALLRAAEARVRDLTQQLALKQTYFDQDAYVRQLQGELQALERKFENFQTRGTDKEKQLEYEVRKLSKQRDVLIQAIQVNLLAIEAAVP